jgi:hypothetical protein
MKKIFTLLAGIILAIVIVKSQDAPPLKFSYKATIIKSNGAIVPNKSVGIQIKIDDGLFVETYKPTTNEYGQIDIVIGEQNNLLDIDWTTGEHFIEVWVDVKGGTNYVLMSRTQLLSVPYALYSKDSQHATEADHALVADKADSESDPVFGAWDRNEGIEIKESQISDLKHYTDADIDGNESAFDGWDKDVSDDLTSGNVVTISGDQTIDGNKTFNNDIIVNELTFGRGNSSKVRNVAIGYQALNSNTDGVDNIALGYQALEKNTTGTNVAVGAFTLSSNTTGDQNTALGTNALYSSTTASNNTAVGHFALSSNETGTANTAVGVSALGANKGSSNTAFGHLALSSNNDGQYNTASGNQSLYSNSSGSFNTANGWQALSKNTTASNNTAIGVYALYLNDTGWDNTATGLSALNSNTNGGQNTANGKGALYTNSTGSNNTAIGFFSGFMSESGSNNVFIGHRAGYYETESDRLYIDDRQRDDLEDARAKSLIYGIFADNPSDQKLTINGEVNVNGNKVINVANPTDPQDAASKAYVDASGGGLAAHYIGEEYGGGIVFYVYDNGQHGLIAGVSDAYNLSHGTTWHAGDYVKTMAIANGIGAGRVNTAIIYAVQGEGNTTKYAARACIQERNEGDVLYGDWYLPSPYEMNLLYEQKSVVGGFADDMFYWSSYENGDQYATCLNFNDGTWHIVDKNIINGVRAIRSF